MLIALEIKETLWEKAMKLGVPPSSIYMSPAWLVQTHKLDIKYCIWISIKVITKYRAGL